MAGGRAYGGNYTFAYTGDYGFLSRAADKPVYIGAHGNARLCTQLYAVLSYGGYYGGFYNLGVNAHLHGV